MKTNKFILGATIFMICFMFFSACKQTEVDYREKWVGDWDFIIDCKWFEGEYSGRDTLFYLGKINCEYNDSILIIDYWANFTNIKVKVDELGKFSIISDVENYYGEGYFEGDNKVYFLRSGGLSLGGGCTDIVEGTKRTKECKQ
ncbi:hypothetical protein LJC69_05745 [Bacteroidales bacterium OttesenSCG-928-K22]|nr:hypothetical protein [Bacteroidales bacterium OttesenSCG-928-L14]MDL2241111.1 hypothetical protein [Bacteroidales bacterium OttesenSCG-928-K22]